ncbi:hypothetical protein C0Q70_01530 [Pomacea canaliculata]|uniref:Uncharacterized protein n=1 Tax=Pomacea canaliculata TaxID=400727 RepID=A0A2T7PZQ3_POMCA|nr:hypothetical protein C0Q70_01530 [Pomacea canaliculata]
MYHRFSLSHRSENRTSPHEPPLLRGNNSDRFREQQEASYLPCIPYSTRHCQAHPVLNCPDSNHHPSEYNHNSNCVILSLCKFITSNYLEFYFSSNYKLDVPCFCIHTNHRKYSNASHVSYIVSCDCNDSTEQLNLAVDWDPSSAR